MIEEQKLKAMCKEENESQIKMEEDICAICLEPFDEFANFIFPSSCTKHFFHNNCMVQLVLQDQVVRCPLDRQTFNSYIYQNAIPNEYAITTEVHWHNSLSQKIFIHNHFKSDQYIGANIYSFDIEGFEETCVDILILEDRVLSIFIDKNGEITEDFDNSCSTKAYGWSLRFNEQHHREITSMKAFVIPTSQVTYRCLIMSFYTNGNEDLIQALLTNSKF